MNKSSPISFQERKELLSAYLSTTGRLFPGPAARFIQENKIGYQEIAQPVERVYAWLHNQVGSCLVCKSSTKFIGFNAGYRSTCSRSCSALSEERREKTKKTLYDRYGVEHQMHSSLIKDKVKATMLDRYGIENALSGKSQVKIDGMLKKYGTTYISQTTEWLEKTDKTFNERYGGRAL